MSCQGYWTTETINHTYQADTDCTILIIAYLAGGNGDKNHIQKFEITISKGDANIINKDDNNYYDENSSGTSMCIQTATVNMKNGSQIDLSSYGNTRYSPMGFIIFNLY